MQAAGTAEEGAVPHVKTMNPESARPAAHCSQSQARQGGGKAKSREEEHAHVHVVEDDNFCTH